MLARTSRGLLPGEAANPKNVRAITGDRKSSECCQSGRVVTMHLAPKQILINAHVNLRDDLVTGDIVHTIGAVEELISEQNQRLK